MIQLRRLVETTALLATLALAAPAGAETVVKIASAQRSVGSLPIVVAQQRGLFAKYGVSIDIIDFNGGGPAVQALASGSTDACLCAADHAVRLASRGLGGAVLVALSETHGYALLEKGDGPYTGIASLKGQRVGITSPGALTDNTVRWAFKKIGINPDTDVELIAAGTGGSMRAAVDRGAVAAGMFTTPDTQSLLAMDGKYKVVEDFRQLKYPALDVVVIAAWLKANDAAAHGFAHAIVDAEKLIQTDPAALRAAIKEYFPTFTPELSEQIAREQTEMGTSKDGVVSKEGYDNLIGVLAIADPSVKPQPYETVVLTKYLP